jgi:hypothetical protein
VHLCGLFAEQKSRHVEIVDHHVAVQPAGARHVARRRRRGIARQDRHQFDLADLSRGDPRPHRREVRIEAPVEADHQAALGGTHNLQAGANARRVEIDRLLAEHRLAGAHRALDQVGMHVGRRADHDRVDV